MRTSKEILGLALAAFGRSMTRTPLLYWATPLPPEAWELRLRPRGERRP